MSTQKISGQFTQRGILCEIKPSREEEVCMMRQMMFRPDGTKRDMLILMDETRGKTVLLNEHVWVEVRETDELWLGESCGKLPHDDALEKRTEIWRNSN